ncbi:hypothetical protein BDN67DRAFT_1003747 [Paxillus ammoniavirescens]|nr:hypothetical protein BDN67DRAFT_1003747 [Paxillus ammoniavirescens]
MPATSGTRCAATKRRHPSMNDEHQRGTDAYLGILIGTIAALVVLMSAPSRPLIVQHASPFSSRNRFHPAISCVSKALSLAALFVFDYCYQLEDEVTFIWSRGNWSVGKALFVPTRYIPFIIIPLTLFGTFSTDINVGTCEGLLYFLVFLEVVAITLSEVIFGLRAYAMWNRNRVVLVVYCCVATAYIAALAFILQSFLPSITFGEAPIALISGCYKTGGSSIVFAAFVIYMLTEAVTTALTLYRAFRHFRHTPNALVQNMTRDGVFYCMSMFGMSVANVLLIFLVPIQYADMIAVYQTVMHTMLATRMQLHLRKVDHHTYLMNLFAEESLAPMSFTRTDDMKIVALQHERSAGSQTATKQTPWRYDSSSSTGSNNSVFTHCAWSCSHKSLLFPSGVGIVLPDDRQEDPRVTFPCFLAVNDETSVKFKGVPVIHLVVTTDVTLDVSGILPVIGQVLGLLTGSVAVMQQYLNSDWEGICDVRVAGDEANSRCG